MLRVTQHYSFETHAYDLSIFDYALYYTLRGRFLWNPFLTERNFLAHHFSPGLLALLPLYVFDDGPLGLLLLQTVVVVASGIPLYLSAKVLLGSRALACGIVVAYFGNPFLIRGLTYDFHPEMLLPVLFLGGLWLIEIKDRPRWGVAVFCLSMLVKEDVPFYVGAVAVYFAIRHRAKVALGLAGASVIYGLSVWLVVLPGLLDGQAPLPLMRWSGFGKTIPEILIHFLSRPGELVAMFISVPLLKLFATFGFLPILAPTGILPAIPALFVNLSSPWEPQRHLSLYYAAPALPFLAWATVRGLQRIQVRIAGRRRLIGAMVVVLMFINLGYAKTYHMSDRDRRGHEIIAKIPRTSSIATQAHFVPHLPKREAMYVVGKTWHRQPVEYILVDEQAGFWPLNRDLVCNW